MDKHDLKQLTAELSALNEQFMQRMHQFSETEFEQYFSKREALFTELKARVAEGHAERKAALADHFKQIAEQDRKIMAQMQALREEASDKLEQIHASRKQRSAYDAYMGSESNSVFFDRTN